MIYRLLAIIALIVITVGYSLFQKKNLDSQLASDEKSESLLKKLPTASFETLDNQVFNLDELYSKERVELLVVHFWGTWCAPCEAELPELLNLIRRYENRPEVKFLLVAVNDEIIKVKKHLKTIVTPKASVHWLIDNKNVFRDQFGTTRVPETYVFSSDKNMLRKYMGPQEWNKSMFYQTFDEFIQISTQKM